ncbi:dTTP/UTP pyrophosphatase [Carnimonas sp. R-84981]|uniref:Maf family protein n=1 Tax=Carnimonas bestiolae TaxID=3402172 RepID=UPI003EDC5F4D
MADVLPLCLASQSPRRLELLASIGVTPALVCAADIDERPQCGEAPANYVARMALGKAQAVVGQYPHGWVLGADTAIALDGQIFGKPASKAAFDAMFEQFSQRWHSVFSAVTLARAGQLPRTLWVESRVHFGRVGTAQRDAYWATGEPVDKAGGYAIQGRGAVFIERLEGSYSAVVGLPLFETAQLLNDAGVGYWQ